MQRLLILNGPPGCGKDTLAAWFAAHYKWNHVEFKARLFAITRAVYNVSQTEWDSIYTRELKEKPTPLLNRKSPREALIYVSEHVIKPAYGDQFFGKELIKSLNNGISICSDGGFIDEVFPCSDVLGVDKIAVIAISRDGCTYAGDSRSYLPRVGPYHHCELDNNGTLGDAYNAVYQYTKSLGWVE